MRKKLLAMLLIGTMLLSLAGCSNLAQVQSKELTKDIAASVTDIKLDESNTADAQSKFMDFSVELFQKSIKEGENTLISPISVMMALSMTANGAKNNTLAQMEDVLGMDMETLNQYLYSYANNLPQGKDYKLESANSIWFIDDDSFAVNEDFLKTNKAYYDASVYKTPFNHSTVKDINLWVNKNTDGMIDGIIKEIPDDTVMYLINTLVFDAKWEEPYKKTQIKERTFTTENGTQQMVDLMYSDENLYLEDENATGFMKYYKDKKYAFVALLPNENISVADYVKGMSGERLSVLLDNVQSEAIDVAIPCFEIEFKMKMKEVLLDMGMADAFSVSAADFSGVGEYAHGNIYINEVLHKTYISVDENGTKAAAVTSVGLNGGAAPMEKKKVYLDRPFVYMLIDCETNQPFFLGTVMSVE